MAFILNAELCPVEDLVEVIMSLKAGPCVEAWILALLREDMKEYFRENFDLVRKIIHNQKSSLPNEFILFAETLPKLKSDEYLMAYELCNMPAFGLVQADLLTLHELNRQDLLMSNEMGGDETLNCKITAGPSKSDIENRFSSKESELVNSVEPQD